MDAGVKAKKSGGPVERARKGGESGAVSTIKTVGIIGAGQMGNGIAHVVSLAGYDVAMYDLKKEAVDKARATIERNMARQVSRGIITDAQMSQALKRIGYASDMASLGEADLVIEAATEDEAVKRKIFTDLCPKLKKDAMVASNTSSISITRLASVTDRPERFIGMHFMNPVPMMQLVELIRGIATEDDTFASARSFIESLGKNIAVSEDFPAFIVNRILLPMINEAVYTLYEGVGTVEVDRQGHAARRQSPDGPAGARRLHRPRHLPVGHAGALRGPGRLQVSPVPAAGEVRRGGLARPQDAARLLRLPRREAGADTLRPISHSGAAWRMLVYRAVKGPSISFPASAFRPMPSAGRMSRIDPLSTIGGLVGAPFTLVLSELGILPRAEMTADFHCVTTWTVPV